MTLSRWHTVKTCIRFTLSQVPFLMNCSAFSISPCLLEFQVVIGLHQGAGEDGVGEEH